VKYAFDEAENSPSGTLWLRDEYNVRLLQGKVRRLREVMMDQSRVRSQGACKLIDRTNLCYSRHDDEYDSWFHLVMTTSICRRIDSNSYKKQEDSSCPGAAS